MAISFCRFEAGLTFLPLPGLFRGGGGAGGGAGGGGGGSEGGGVVDRGNHPRNEDNMAVYIIIYVSLCVGVSGYKV